MKITLEDIKVSIKTKSEASLTINGLWLARSGIGIQIDNEAYPVFGFSSSFDYLECEEASMYELLENLSFLPSIYSGIDANKHVLNVAGDLKFTKSEKKISDFLNGAPGLQGLFYSNGCAVSSNVQNAITHSRYELFERHICCEIWYKQAHLLEELECSINVNDPNIKITGYTVDTSYADIYNAKFAIAVIDSPKINFFALGASVKLHLKAALKHAVGEAIMVFEDAIRGRKGYSPTAQMRQNILSLRDAAVSQKRREHFKSLLCKKEINTSTFPIVPKLQTIIFEPFPKIYAARTFSCDALEPEQFKEIAYLPTMPLF